MQITILQFCITYIATLHLTCMKCKLTPVFSISTFMPYISQYNNVDNSIIIILSIIICISTVCRAYSYH